METSGFLKAPCGRILIATAAWAAIAGGFVIAAMASSTTAVALVTMASVVGGTFAVGLAIERFPMKALALILALPLAGTLYWVGLTTMGGRPIGGGILLAIGLALAWSALHRTPAPRMQPIAVGARPALPTPSGR